MNLVLTEQEMEVLWNEKVVSILRPMEPKPIFGESGFGWDFQYQAKGENTVAMWSPATLFPSGPTDRCPIAKIGDRLILNTNTKQCESVVGVVFINVVHIGKPLDEIRKFSNAILIAELRAWKWFWKITLVLLEAHGKIMQRALIPMNAISQ